MHVFVSVVVPSALAAVVVSAAVFFIHCGVDVGQMVVEMDGRGNG
jgi:hypothetical protein